VLRCILCLLLPSDHHNLSKLLFITLYIAFLYIGLLDVVHDYMHPPRKAREMMANFWFGVHAWLISRIVTLLGIAAIYFQAKAIRSRPWEHALSRTGLAVQACMFGLVAVSWVFRVEYTWPDWVAGWDALMHWYMFVGWAAVDNVVFALGQGVLLWVVVRSGARVGEKGEMEPLLRT